MTDEEAAEQRRDLQLDALASPRVIKSHLPLYLLPPKLVDTCKVVYVARNPKDVIVSFYHHHRLIPLHDYHGDFEEFANYFLNDESKTTKSFPLKHHIAITASSLWKCSLQRFFLKIYLDFLRQASYKVSCHFRNNYVKIPELWYTFGIY